MRHAYANRLGTYIGVALLALAIIGFIFTMLTSLPTDSKVNAIAVPLKDIPRDLFSSQNDLNKVITGLNTPSGVPVTVSPSNLGRTNVFENP